MKRPLKTVPDSPIKNWSPGRRSMLVMRVEQGEVRREEAQRLYCIEDDEFEWLMIVYGRKVAAPAVGEPR